MSIKRKTVRELLCDRFLLAWEATGLSKGEFASRVGLSASQFSNISTYRNPPSHEVIAAAMREFGFTSDWFYSGSLVGFRDADLASKIRRVHPPIEG